MNLGLPLAGALLGTMYALAVGPAAADSAPIIVQPGATRTTSLAFTVGRAVQCTTFGRRRIVHVPTHGETTVRFRTHDGAKVWLYLVHFGANTHIMCGAATSFGGH